MVRAFLGRYYEQGKEHFYCPVCRCKLPDDAEEFPFYRHNLPRGCNALLVSSLATWVEMERLGQRKAP